MPKEKIQLGFEVLLTTGSVNDSEGQCGLASIPG